MFTHIPLAETLEYLREARRVLQPGGFVLFSFLDLSVDSHRVHSITERSHHRAPWLDAIVTKLFCAPNVFTRPDEIPNWAALVGLQLSCVEGPTKLGQSYAVLKKAR